MGPTPSSFTGYWTQYSPNSYTTTLLPLPHLPIPSILRWEQLLEESNPSDPATPPSQSEVEQQDFCVDTKEDVQQFLSPSASRVTRNNGRKRPFNAGLGLVYDISLAVPESIGVAEPGVKGKVQLLFKQELPEFGGQIILILNLFVLPNFQCIGPLSGCFL